MKSKISRLKIVIALFFESLLSKNFNELTVKEFLQFLNPVDLSGALEKDQCRYRCTFQRRVCFVGVT